MHKSARPCNPRMCRPSQRVSTSGITITISSAMRSPRGTENLDCDLSEMQARFQQPAKTATKAGGTLSGTIVCVRLILF